MNIRKASDSDIPAIIQLLKVSLGESLIPKSEALWNWKHVQNPFGKSPVLLDEENGEILGVRAFLMWEFFQNGKIFKSCRAVDTATHPEHQGKGIFKKLTMALIEEIKKNGMVAVFNTPNSKSTPGYLKMGWEKWGNLPLKLDFHVGKKRKGIQMQSDWTAISDLIEEIESAPQTELSLGTRLVKGYLNWRYKDSPLFPYHYLSDGENYLLIYRIKEGKMGREFRICDFYFLTELSPSQKKELNKSLAVKIRESGSRFSSFSGLKYSQQKNLDMGILPVIKIGPLVTVRQVQEDFYPLNQDWSWSLGDLEVF